MLGRDKITLHLRDRETEVETTKVVMGRVITERLEGQTEEPLKGRPLFGINKYRLLLPRSLEYELGDSVVISVDFGGRTGLGARFEAPVTPIYDARGRIHHYEGIVKSG
ncbi:hypothetical protein EB75_17795 [Mycobacterium sp. ST-F2]|uniref:hypothetical protein n=1 Tax=Mycobacterium sp. ST-F2 TaxID=1490484 RepID=UPI00093FA65C|nr:hypothetical protein [Mycobacterium sp. ST-F2]OKH81172.1 hypothetical protein EB75_17795 [Mycobacterium sp. ST-F2]